VNTVKLFFSHRSFHNQNTLSGEGTNEQNTTTQQFNVTPVCAFSWIICPHATVTISLGGEFMG
jgi:hypothetical protein